MAWRPGALVYIQTIIVTIELAMAYLVRRSPTRFEIRESRSTPRGPRSRVLASFLEALTRDVLDRAAARATRPVNAAALVRRARTLGIPVLERSREPEARALLSRLRRGDPLDPDLVATVAAWPTLPGLGFVPCGGLRTALPLAATPEVLLGWRVLLTWPAFPCQLLDVK